MNRNPVDDWQELSALYEQADGLDAPALDEWLATLEARAHPMLAQLRRMLSAREKVRHDNFLGELPTLAAVPEPIAEPWVAGKRVGPYRLISHLGTGGMAEVWLARRDDGAFERQVAIKLLFRHAGSDARDSFAQRFTRERDILASLDHPHIASLHDAGVTPIGQPWLALEYVQGEPLIAWCDRARLGVTARMRLFRQVLLAVQHAHANLVIHRDLKPANILVTTQGEARLLDFGIAKLLEAEGVARDETELTRQAGRPLTVRYASPEQLAGRPLTTASDVYSLGVVLYELLCGEMPYEIKGSRTATQLEHAILEADPREPSRRSLSEITARDRGTAPHALRRALAPELDAVTLRCLAKDPAARYSSVDALLADVDRWLTGEAVLARSPSAWYRFGKFTLRHRWAVGFGAAAVLSLAATATVAVIFALQARQESARALAARDFMMGIFKQADTDKSRGADLTARELLDRGREDVTRRLSARPDLQADLLSGIAGIQYDMQEYTKADATFEQLARSYVALKDSRHAALAIAARANNAFQMGDSERAAALVEQARAAAPRAAGDLELEASLGLTQGWLALGGGDAARAKALFVGSRAMAESALGPSHAKVLDALVGLVQAETSLKDFDAALAAQADLESRTVRTPGFGPRQEIDSAAGRVDLLYRAGHFRESLDRDRLAIDRCRSALGPNDAWCRRLISMRVALLVRLGLPREAIADLPVLDEMAKDASSPDLQVAVTATTFRVRSALGEDRTLVALAARLRDIGTPGTGATIDPARRIQALQLLAEHALRQGRVDEAEQLVGEAAAQTRATLDHRPGFAIAGVNATLLGAIRSSQHRYDEALALFRQARAHHAAVLGAAHPLTWLNSLNEAVVLGELGRANEATAIVDRAEPELRRAFGDAAPLFSRVLRLKATLSPPRAVAPPGSAGRADDFFT